MINWGIGYVEKSPSSSTISSSEPSSNSVTLLVEQLKAKVFEVDLFKQLRKILIL